MMANVHFFYAGAYDYVLAHGGKIEKRDENAYNVDIPEQGLIALGGYSYHRGNCTLYAFDDGKVLDFTVETGNHSLTLKRLRQGELQYFGSVENKEQLEALAKRQEAEILLKVYNEQEQKLFQGGKDYQFVPEHAWSDLEDQIKALGFGLNCPPQGLSTLKSL